MALEKLVKNFMEMPVWLMFLSILGLFTPILAIYTVATGKASTDILFDFVLFVALFSTVPTFISSILMYLKLKISKLIYIFGWFLVCFTPLISDSAEVEINILLMDIVFYCLVGGALTIYLFLSKEVKTYFCQ